MSRAARTHCGHRSADSVASRDAVGRIHPGESAVGWAWHHRRVHLGLFNINMGAQSSPDRLRAAAQAAEAAGFESLWAGEHVVLPDPQVPPSPMAPQDPALDPFIALTYAAAVTERDPAGDRDRDHAAAQPGRARQADRQPRRAQRRPLHARDRGRLPRAGVPGDRRQLPRPRRGHRRVRRGDAGALVPAGPGVRRRVTSTFAGVDAHPRPVQQRDPGRRRRPHRVRRTAGQSRAATVGTGSR